MVKLPPRIKVFLTRIGFRDWVVATSSKQAALDAWDVSINLFAAGQAEQTDDPAAIKLALATIGKAVPMPRAGAMATSSRAKASKSRAKSKRAQ
jgi:hypothetical protein